MRLIGFVFGAALLAGAALAAQPGERTMEQRITMITLRVDDLERAKAFYRALGWSPAQEQGDFVLYQLRGLNLALYPRSALRREIRPEDPEVGPAALAYNLADKEAVDRVFAAALRAGARSIRAPAQQFWGGYSGVFADTEGNYWEVAFNPFMPLDGPPGAGGGDRGG